MFDDILPEQRAPAKEAWPPPSNGGGVRGVLAATVVYFTLVLAVVLALGPVRQFFVGSGTDPLFASLAEATAVALVMTYGSGWAPRFFGVPARLGARLIVGVCGMGLLCAFVVLVALFVRVPASAAWSALQSSSGMVAVLTVVLGAVLPLARVRG